MRKSAFFAVPALAMAGLAMSAAPAMADTAEQESWSVQTSLSEVNGSGTSGEAMIDVHGSEATVSMNVAGAAETFQDGPFPHAQHIHISGQGVCPTMDADEDGDGVVSTPEGQPSYGTIGTSLTLEGDTSADSALAVERYPGGAEYTYERTFELNDDTLAAIEDGSAVVVVHGVNPELLSAEGQEKMSPLNEELPLAATAPAACGTLTASQMEEMPEGGADTGSPVNTDEGSTMAMAGAGALGLAAVGGGAWALHRRSVRS